MLNFMVWNFHGATSNEFMKVLKNCVKQRKPHIIALLKPRISGEQANRVCKKISFTNWVRVEELGFSGGI